MCVCVCVGGGVCIPICLYTYIPTYIPRVVWCMLAYLSPPSSYGSHVLVLVLVFVSRRDECGGATCMSGQSTHLWKRLPHAHHPYARYATCAYEELKHPFKVRTAVWTRSRRDECGGATGMSGQSTHSWKRMPHALCPNAPYATCAYDQLKHPFKVTTAVWTGSKRDECGGAACMSGQSTHSWKLLPRALH